MVSSPIHPFPARMAPEVALQSLASLSAGSLVLDPMAGSGTVIRAAANRNLNALGLDLDPLAVLMTSVWVTPIDVEKVQTLGRALLAKSAQLPASSVELPWIDSDVETLNFIAFWYASRQIDQLRRLSFLLIKEGGPEADVLRLALSRTIITKDKGASLGRDISHSRPHRASTENNFDVFIGFEKSLSAIVRRLRYQCLSGGSKVALGDARDLSSLSQNQFDALVSSPPYLNAIDYMRGHRLALIWLGHTISSLRSIRSNSVGAERGPSNPYQPRDIRSFLPENASLPSRITRMIERYAIDLQAMTNEAFRVLKPNSLATYVIGNSTIRGQLVDNAGLLTASALNSGFHLQDRTERPLPPNRRYLPPPSGSTTDALHSRMRTEVVLVLRK